MSQYLAIVAYRCLVAGTPRGKLDIQVQWHEATDEGVVRLSITSKPIHNYLGSIIGGSIIGVSS